MRISSVIRSIVTGVLAGIGTAFISTVVLAIINIYLTGHNITWQEDTYRVLFFSGTFLDMLMLFFSFTAMAAAAYFSYRGRR